MIIDRLSARPQLYYFGNIYEQKMTLRFPSNQQGCDTMQNL